MASGGPPGSGRRRRKRQGEARRQCTGGAWPTARGDELSLVAIRRTQIEACPAIDDLAGRKLAGALARIEVDEKVGDADAGAARAVLHHLPSTQVERLVDGKSHEHAPLDVPAGLDDGARKPDLQDLWRGRGRRRRQRERQQE